MNGSFGRTGFSLSAFFRVSLRSQKSTKTLMPNPAVTQKKLHKEKSKTERQTQTG
jgi:hypothetical protein